MKSKLAFAIVGGMVFGLSCSSANAGEWKNQYFYTQAAPVRTAIVAPAPATTTINENSVMIEQSLPVAVETTTVPLGNGLTVEDRIVKKKHFFKLGLWPLFDVSIW